MNKNSRTNNNRSNTLPHNNSLNNGRNSQSQSKQNHSKGTSNISTKQVLAPINEQNVIEKPYYLGKGNNHQLIKNVLNRRKGWGEVSNNQTVLLRWTQTSQSFKFHALGRQCLCFNHFQYHRQLSNKQRLVQNLVNFCEANKINAYSFIPVTYILDLTTGEEDLAMHSFIKFYNRNYPGQNVNNNPAKRYQTVILPRNKYNPYLSAQQLNKRSQGNFYCKPYCPKTFVDEESKAYLWILKPTFLNRGRGVALFRELQELQKMIWKYYEGEGLEDYGQKYQIPEKSFIQLQSEEQKKQENQQTMTKKQEDLEVKEQIQVKQEIQVKQQQQKNQQEHKKQQKYKKEQKKTEMMEQKPLEQDGKRPIHMSQSEIPSQTSNNKQLKCFSFIIQKYIEKPMLIDGKKFDIRVWVVLNQSLQVFMFQEGYLRFSSQPYSTKNNHMNPFIHLTNNSVQKYCSEYDKTSGNQVTLSDLVNYLPQNKAASIFNGIKAKIKEIIWLSMCSVRRKININSRKECFQLFGYDFMIDKEHKVWLIQVNNNPALEESSPLLKTILPRMIDDMFKLTIDKLFNSKMKEEVEPFSMDGFNDDQNAWSYIGDLKEGANDRNNGRRLTFARR